RQGPRRDAERRGRRGRTEGRRAAGRARQEGGRSTGPSTCRRTGCQRRRGDAQSPEAARLRPVVEIAFAASYEDGQDWTARAEGPIPSRGGARRRTRLRRGRVRMSERPRVAITMGDAAGIGPEITVKSLADPAAAGWCIPFVLGDAAVLEH